MTTQIKLQRERCQDGDTRETIVRIGDEWTEDDGWEVDMGEVGPTQSWWDVPLPPCPDCCGELVWWEAGYVPGTRKCIGCHSLFSVQTETVTEPESTEPERLYCECDNGHVWQPTPAEDAAADHKCPTCGEYWV